MTAEVVVGSIVRFKISVGTGSIVPPVSPVPVLGAVPASVVAELVALEDE